MNAIEVALTVLFQAESEDPCRSISQFTRVRLEFMAVVWIVWSQAKREINSAENTTIITLSMDGYCQSQVAARSGPDGNTLNWSWLVSVFCRLSSVSRKWGSLCAAGDRFNAAPPDGHRCRRTQGRFIGCSGIAGPCAGRTLLTIVVSPLSIEAE